jgi:hypothetical protein
LGAPVQVVVRVLAIAERGGNGDDALIAIVAERYIYVNELEGAGDPDGCASGGKRNDFE